MTASSARPAALTRRSLLVGAGALALAACTPDPGSDTPASTPPTPLAPGPVIQGQLTSKAMAGQQPWAIMYPPGAAAGDQLPVAVAMHGLGDAVVTAVDQLAYPTHLAAAVAAGAAPFAVAIVDAGETFYQKRGRQDGGKLIAEEFVPFLAKQGLDTARLGLTGWSMGGWGALRLAGNELAGAASVVAALSTPCYESFDTVPEQNWMTKAEFDANNFMAVPEALAGLPLWLACGESDAFFPGNEAFADLLDGTEGVISPARVFGPGNHAKEYWAAQATAQFDFISQHL